jgi:mercuric ion binding protein
MRISPFIAALLLSGSAFADTPETITLDVQNMTCAACPITVRKALERVPGVSDAKVDYKHKTATVHLNKDTVDAALLTKATTDAGFPSTIKK